MKNKVKCKLCRRYILRKTARKYQGYSRQCYNKYIDLKIETTKIQAKKAGIINDDIKNRLSAVLPREKPIHETDNLIWSRNWENKLMVQEKVYAWIMDELRIIFLIVLIVLGIIGINIFMKVVIQEKK